MNQYIIKVHPNLKHEDGLIVVNAENFEKAKELSKDDSKNITKK